MQRRDEPWPMWSVILLLCGFFVGGCYYLTHGQEKPHGDNYQVAPNSKGKFDVPEGRQMMALNPGPAYLVFLEDGKIRGVTACSAEDFEKLQSGEMTVEQLHDKIKQEENPLKAPEPLPPSENPKVEDVTGEQPVSEPPPPPLPPESEDPPPPPPEEDLLPEAPQEPPSVRKVMKEKGQWREPQGPLPQREPRPTLQEPELYVRLPTIGSTFYAWSNQQARTGHFPIPEYAFMDRGGAIIAKRSLITLVDREKDTGVWAANNMFGSYAVEPKPEDGYRGFLIVPAMWYNEYAKDTGKPIVHFDFSISDPAEGSEVQEVQRAEPPPP